VLGLRDQVLVLSTSTYTQTIKQHTQYRHRCSHQAVKQASG